MACIHREKLKGGIWWPQGMWSPAWLFPGEVPRVSWGWLPDLRRSAQVEREAPAMGEVFDATSALHLMTAASLARETFWEFFLETRI